MSNFKIISIFKLERLPNDTKEQKKSDEGSENTRCMQNMNGGQTCLSPRCVSAEHSIYFTALILLANF